MPQAIAAALLAGAGLRNTPRLDIAGAEPVLPSSFRVDAAAAASIGAAAVAAAALWRLRTGTEQQVRLTLRDAAAAFRSDRYLRVDGSEIAERWDRIAGAYRTRDGWVRLQTNLPHHRDGMLRLLGCDHSRDSVTAQLARWESEAFETAATQAGLCVAAYRDFTAWDAHPHAIALQGQPPLRLDRFADAPPEAMTPGPQAPLSGVRVLDLTRVIAGPVAGRTLASYGADVLHITSPNLPNLPDLLLDTARGKRCAQLDLLVEADRSRFRQLVASADIVLQSYRPGALAGLGFGPQVLQTLRPGLIQVNLSAYGAHGPWGGKRGFDSLVQTATGFNHAEAKAAGQEAPKPLPCQALDHASGYLLALGAMTALHHRARTGGAWQVNVALATTAAWLRGLGRIDGLGVADQTAADIADLFEDNDSVFGRITALRPAALLSATPARYARPTEAANGSDAVWLPL